MIRILNYSSLEDKVSQLDMDDLPGALKDPEGLLWVDIADTPNEEVEPFLSNTFGFHPLAIDDALRESHVPKVDDWQEYLYIVLRAVSYGGGGRKKLAAPELDIFLGSNYVVSFSLEPLAAIDRVWQVVQKDQRWMMRGASYLLYHLADDLVAEAVEAAEELQDELELVESKLFADAGSATPERLLALKRSILLLRRIVVPQRDVLNRLSRNEYQIVNAADRIFFRDVYDHLLQLDNRLDDLIILVIGVRDTYLSVVNNRMNDIMKTLTVITAFFMPLAFITGFFGMNFFQAVPPFSTWTSGLAFVVVLAAMLLIPLVMFYWMRRRAWI